MAKQILLAGWVAAILVGCNTVEPTSIPEVPAASQQDDLELHTDESYAVGAQPTVQIAVEEIDLGPCSGVLTPANPEGPFYTPGAPERSSLIESGVGGTPLLLTGRVMTSGCEPLPGALLDFWQTDASGEYDNEGFRFRGKLFAGENGEYQLETILPGLYPGRPAHIHVKVTPPGRPEHTTQIYFPGPQFGDADQFVNPALVATLKESSRGNRVATFNFVLSP